VNADAQIVETALGVTADQIAALSDAELLVLADAVGLATGEEIVKVSDREKAIERKMRTVLTEDYEEGVDEALAAELPGLPEDEVSTDEASLLLADVGRRLDADLAGERGDRMRDALLAGVAALLLIGRKSGKAAVAATGRPTSTISGSLTQVDREAVAALSEQQLWWIGRLWNDHLSKTISATVTREALVAGLGREEVGRIVRGVVGGTFPAAKVPGTWPGSVEGYFTSLAGTVRNQATNQGLIATFVEGGVRRYRIVAVMDKRTSLVCQTMNNRTFEVRAGARLATARLDAEDPEAVKDLSRWRSAKQVEELTSEADPEAALERAGMALPPYHGNCRTVISPD
jgi:hypothetical protein